MMMYEMTSEMERLESARRNAIKMKRPSAALAVTYARARLSGLDIVPSRLNPLGWADRDAIKDVLPILERLGIIPADGSATR